MNDNKNAFVIPKRPGVPMSMASLAIDDEPAPVRQYIPDFDEDDELSQSAMTSQMEALYYLIRGDNMLLCGQAGTGKSWVVSTFRNLIMAYSDELERNGRKFNLEVTASTGAAAALIFGKTVHSWSGLGIRVDDFDPEDLRGRDKAVWIKAKRRIRDTDCLIVDEVSMLPAYFLTNLDRACRNARGNDKPFGGLQIVLVGDFMQLPPVDTGQLDSHGEVVDARYCFRSPSFLDADFTCCYLDRIRRSGDDRLNALLNAIREQRLDAKLLAPLMERFNAKPDPKRAYTRLHTMNRNVDEYNKRRLESLGGAVHTFGAYRSGDPDDCKAMIKDGKIRPVDLKTGAVVMLTSNVGIPGSHYVNGSMGKVIGFDDDHSAVNVRFNDGGEELVRRIPRKKTVVEQRQVTGDDGFEHTEDVERVVAEVDYLPLRLAWAITVHKSQGMTLDGAIIDLTRSFQRGLGYVALSRTKSLDSVIMEGRLPKDALLVDPEAIAIDAAIRRRAVAARAGFARHEGETRSIEGTMGFMSKTERRAAVAKIGDSPSAHALFASDRAVIDYIADHRARRVRRRKA